MASTAIKNEEEKKEYFDTHKELEKKCEQLAKWILESNHFCAFTGAGISTAAGIPDYRSGAKTVMPTGAGCWEKAAAIEKARKEGKINHEPIKGGLRTTISKAVPTKCHMSMVKLMEEGYLKHIISQNIDGLHRRSGIPAQNMSEVHGNTNLEHCLKCGKEYMRDYRVRNAQKTKDHKTGRKCDDPKCKGDLADSIINFGENLNQAILNQGYDNGTCADVMLAMGSSLRVNPAADMAAITSRMGGKLVIVNLQKTPLDDQAALIIHAKIDDMFEILMKKLNMSIPQFKLKRWIKASYDSKNKFLKVNGVDQNGAPYDLFKSIKIDNMTGNTQPVKGNSANISMTFQAHYGEPEMNLTIPLSMFENRESMQIEFVYNPFTRQWESCVADKKTELKFCNGKAPVGKTEAEKKEMWKKAVDNTK